MTGAQSFGCLYSNPLVCFAVIHLSHKPDLMPANTMHSTLAQYSLFMLLWTRLFPCPPSQHLRALFILLACAKCWSHSLSFQLTHIPGSFSYSYCLSPQTLSGLNSSVFFIPAIYLHNGQLWLIFLCLLLMKTWQLTMFHRCAYHLGYSGPHSDMGVKKYEAYFGSVVILNPSSRLASFKMSFFNKTHRLLDSNSSQKYMQMNRLQPALTCHEANMLIELHLCFQKPHDRIINLIVQTSLGSASIPRKLPQALDSILKLVFTVSHCYCSWQFVSGFSHVLTFSITKASQILSGKKNKEWWIPSGIPQYLQNLVEGALSCWQQHPRSSCRDTTHQAACPTAAPWAKDNISDPSLERPIKFKSIGLGDALCSAFPSSPVSHS